jgi:hypothetical protein
MARTHSEARFQVALGASDHTIRKFVLERTLTAVREKTQVKHEGAEVSTFLREVAEHKKKLSKKSKSERIIIE